MKSDTPDELFVFPDFSSLGPNCVLLSSEADSFFFSSSIGFPNRPDISLSDHFVNANEMYFSEDDLPF